MSGRSFQRGQVYWVDFLSARGGKIGKVRSAIIVSNDDANRHLNRVQVVPLTRSTGRVFKSEAIVYLNGVRNKAVADQIGTATKERIGDYIANLSPADMKRVERAVITQLALE